MEDSRLPTQKHFEGFGLGSRTRYCLHCVALMGLFYAALYHPYAVESVPGRALLWYLEATANVSAALLRALGENVSVQGTQVFGRFSYVVVLDCAALDAQSLFAAAVIAFPARRWFRVVGVAAGLLLIGMLNVARLAGLYFAGAKSLELFQLLHEEVLVFVLVASVCLIFFAWVRWVLRSDAGTLALSPTQEQPHAV